MNLEQIIAFLQQNGWSEEQLPGGATRFTSPPGLQMEPPIVFDIPRTIAGTNGEIFIQRVLETLGQVYDIPTSDVGHFVRPFINCNAQIYTADNMPPYLLRTIFPWPYYQLFSLSMIVPVFRRIKRMMKKRTVIQSVRQGRRRYYVFRHKLFRILWPLKPLLHVFILLQLYFLFIAPQLTGTFIRNLNIYWKPLFVLPNTVYSKTGLLLFIFLFYHDARSFLIFLLRKLGSVLRSISGKQYNFVTRYTYNMVAFSPYNKSENILRLLASQYPESTGFLIHTIDLEYMKAGKPKQQYLQQLEELDTCLEKAHRDARYFALLFTDPRRIREEDTFFSYYMYDHKVVLNDCLVNKYINQGRGRFIGFKMMPSLGYYPFDEELLPLWKYAADNNLPVVVHCASDALYYRGVKKEEDYYHPVFRENFNTKNNWEIHEWVNKSTPLFLHQEHNSAFTRNYSHPLNYFCLLHEPLLRELVGRSKNQKIKSLFGYRDSSTPLLHNLAGIRLCFSHFGGADEWHRFMQTDRVGHINNELLRKPNEGIALAGKIPGSLYPKLALAWNEAGWYPVICSLMLQYPNIYADISHISANPALYPMLNRTLQNPRLKTKVLMGTDFYLNHREKSEFTVLSELSEHLTEEELNLIGRDNPRRFLGVV